MSLRLVSSLLSRLGLGIGNWELGMGIWLVGWIVLFWGTIRDERGWWWVWWV